MILVVDARPESQRCRTLLHGFSTFDTATRIAGMYPPPAFRSDRWREQVLRQACDQAGVAVLGHSAQLNWAADKVSGCSYAVSTAVAHGSPYRAMKLRGRCHVDLAAVIACAGSQAAPPAMGW